MHGSIHSRNAALRNSGKTTDFLLANIWRANLEGLSLLRYLCLFLNVCESVCVLLHTCSMDVNKDKQVNGRKLIMSPNY